jgi:hypothetical protein
LHRVFQRPCAEKQHRFDPGSRRVGDVRPARMENARRDGRIADGGEALRRICTRPARIRAIESITGARASALPPWSVVRGPWSDPTVGKTNQGSKTVATLLIEALA